MPARRWMMRLRDRLRRTATGRDEGFTLIEAVVSFVVFAIVTTSASVGIVNAMKSSHLSQQRVEAAQIASYWINDAIRRASNIEAAPAPGLTIQSAVGDPDKTQGGYAEGEQFKVMMTVVYDAGGTCNDGTMFTVNVAVYQKQTDQFLARNDARVACPHV